MNTIIIYGSNYGTSKKVAEILQQKIEGNVDIYDINNISNIDIDKADNIIIGAGIKIGQIPRNLKKWVEENKDKILNTNTYIYICAGEEDKIKRKELIRVNFPEEILAKSRYSSCVGGSLDLNNLNFIIRILLKKIRKDDNNINTLSNEEIDKLAIIANKQVIV